jgi:ElaB/YqjD/DUF883 family membrane-anchored ribosome-binding protein
MFSRLGLIPNVFRFKIFNRDLTKDEAKRIGATLTTRNEQQPCNLNDLLEDVAKLHDSKVKARSQAHQRIDSVVTALNTHAQVIDVFIQQQPDITAVVWGAVRFLIGVC